jgi:hypothetical protein
MGFFANCVAVFVVAVALFEASRPAYEVHTSGAVVITGASSGIGLHAAVTLAGRGFTVFAGVRKEQDAASVLA